MGEFPGLSADGIPTVGPQWMEKMIASWSCFTSRIFWPIIPPPKKSVKTPEDFSQERRGKVKELQALGFLRSPRLVAAMLKVPPGGIHPTALPGLRLFGGSSGVPHRDKRSDDAGGRVVQAIINRGITPASGPRG